MQKKVYLILLVLTLVLFAGCRPSVKKDNGSVPEKTDPVIYYSFDDGSEDTVTDSSGEGNDGTLIGDAEWNEEGQTGGAVFLPGGDVEGYVQLPDDIFAGMQSMTVAVWVKPMTAHYAWSRVFEFCRIEGDTPNGFIYLTLNGFDPDGEEGEEMDHVRFTLHDRNPETEVILLHPNDSLQLDEWAHIVVTASASECCLFINGEKTAVLENVQHVPGDISPDNNNHLGKSVFPDPYFCGMFDEFYLYNRVLSDDEIAVLYMPDVD